jgi:hypothetical protein
MAADRQQQVSAINKRSWKASRDTQFRAFKAAARVRTPLVTQSRLTNNSATPPTLSWLWPELSDASSLVVDGWVEDQVADDLLGGCVDDADCEAVLDPHTT